MLSSVTNSPSSLSPAFTKPLTPTSRTEEMSGREKSDKFQDLSANAVFMGDMKTANRASQLAAMRAVLDDQSRPQLRVVDVGAGDGLTAPVWAEAVRSKDAISLLAIDMNASYKTPYLTAHSGDQFNRVNIIDYHVAAYSELPPRWLAKKLGGEADIIFASHSLYAELQPMREAGALLPRPAQSSAAELKAYFAAHPMTKYLDALANGGVMVITLGATQAMGAMRRFITEVQTQNINGMGACFDPDKSPVIKEFDNMDSFIKLFSLFKARYEAAYDCELQVRSHPSATQTPIGSYRVELDAQTDIFMLRNPLGRDDDPSWQAPRLFNTFSGGWPTRQEAAALSAEDRVKVRARQQTFLNLLPLFEVEGMFCQHDETLEIRKFDKLAGNPTGSN